VLFHFPDAQGIVDAFQGKAVAHVYGRSSSPTSSHLQQLLCRYHGALGAVTFSTGMAAISSTMFSLLRAGDHIVVSHFLFGNTRSFIQSLTGFGIAVSFVDITQCDEVKRAMQDNTRMVFCESLANPLTQIPDLAGIGKICQANGSLFMLDTTMTPHVMLDVTQYPVDLVITSLTKYIAGHGHAMGGAVLDMGRFDWSQYPHIEALYQVPDVTMRGLTQIRKKGLRDIGATLDPHAAGQILLGQETLAMRYAKAVNNAATIAAELASHDLIQHVYHPSLKSHPQSDLANEQFSAHGALLSFDLVADIDPVAFINRLSLILCATHLGDTRTLALPVTQTIFYEFSQAQRDAMGITDACVRLSIGIEEPEDLLADLRQALAFFA
jgi:O-acetylhomoserine (thiol)-lyase